MLKPFWLLLLPEDPFHRRGGCLQQAAAASLCPRHPHGSLQLGALGPHDLNLSAPPLLGLDIPTVAPSPAPLLSLNCNFLQTLHAKLHVVTNSRVSTPSSPHVLPIELCVLHTAGPTAGLGERAPAFSLFLGLGWGRALTPPLLACQAPATMTEQLSLILLLL